MILSWRLARARIERGERPGWLAAWGPVAFDLAAVLVVAVMVFRVYVALGPELSVAGHAGVLLVLLFLPSQAALIASALWATKSRWVEEDETRSPE